MTIYDGLERIFLPRWLNEHADHGILRAQAHVHYYDSILACCLERQPEKICIYRTYALGDILMMLPLVRHLYRIIAPPNPILVVVEKRFMSSLAAGLRGWEEIRFRPQLPRGEIADYGADVHVNLNGVLEPDHWGGEESDRHRVDLYAEAFGFEVTRAES